MTYSFSTTKLGNAFLLVGGIVTVIVILMTLYDFSYWHTIFVYLAVITMTIGALLRYWRIEDGEVSHKERRVITPLILLAGSIVYGVWFTILGCYGEGSDSFCGFGLLAVPIISLFVVGVPILALSRITSYRSYSQRFKYILMGLAAIGIMTSVIIIAPHVSTIIENVQEEIEKTTAGPFASLEDCAKVHYAETWEKCINELVKTEDDKTRCIEQLKAIRPTLKGHTTSDRCSTKALWDWRNSQPNRMR